MTDSQDPLSDFQNRLLVLKLAVDHLAGSMQAESEEARRALTLYPRCRALLNRLLGQAAGHQARAAHLGQRLNLCRHRLEELQIEGEKVIEQLTGQDPEQVTIVRRDLRQIREQIRAWSVESDGLR